MTAHNINATYRNNDSFIVRFSVWFPPTVSFIHLNVFNFFLITIRIFFKNSIHFLKRGFSPLSLWLIRYILFTFFLNHKKENRCRIKRKDIKKNFNLFLR
jgi:hypothetical protein